MYMALKHLHLTSVALSIILFSLRGFWMLQESPQLQKKWVKILPHIVDTILLASAIALTFVIHQYPFHDGWLTAKLGGLIAYILLGTIALKRGKTKGIRISALIGAYLVLAYVISVAITKSPWPFG